MLAALCGDNAFPRTMADSPSSQPRSLGKVAVQGMNKATADGVVKEFWPTGAGGGVADELVLGPAAVAQKTRLPSRPPPQESHQQVPGHTHERMHVQLLIGPVELGTGGQHARVLQVAEGGHDFRGAPLAAIGNQNP